MAHLKSTDWSFFFFLIYCAILKSSACPSPKFHVLDLLLPTTFSRLKINDHHSIHKQTPKEEKSKSQIQKKTNRIDWWCSRTTVTKTHHRLFCFFFFLFEKSNKIFQIVVIANYQRHHRRYPLTAPFLLPPLPLQSTRTGRMLSNSTYLFLSTSSRIHRIAEKSAH